MKTLLLILMFAWSAHAATYFVDVTNGLNSNNGTSSGTAMKWLFITLLLCGCVQGPTVPPKPLLEGYSRQSEATIQPPPFPVLKWEWDPGDYTNFLVFTSKDIAKPLSLWSLYADTTGNSFVVTNKYDTAYFAVLAVREDGFWAWIQK